ncbi:MAG: phosphoenolpyruvate--protein phosphotransferase [Kiritimatiellae bacterium]|nr:phosphoenolpyruvate--protein phosphotransferase [Kiritimatiellia bacterium]
MSSRGRDAEILKGLPVSPGCAAGGVYIFPRRPPDSGEGGHEIPPELVEHELKRLENAREECMRDLDALATSLGERLNLRDTRLFECHRMMLDDPLLIGEIRSLVSNGGLNAEGAVHRAAEALRSKFEKMSDQYFRERVLDLDDVERRLLDRLSGTGSDVPVEMPGPAIVVADDLTPSETMRLPHAKVLGIVTDRGSLTSHVALLARALGIPCIAGLGDISSRVSAGERILIDGAEGSVILNPDESAEKAFSSKAEQEREAAAVPQASAGSLRNGGSVGLYVNLHPGMPFDGARKSGARGIGLYRSEYLWIERGEEPGEEEQYKAYHEAAQLARELSPDAPVVIRVLDIGGDKAVAGVGAHEENPFLGNRSIRYLLSRPDVFRRQVRAILRASEGGHVRLMYPMISCVEEVDAANALVDEVKGELVSSGADYAASVRVGAMIEVPAAALVADAIARKVDFLSIGTNDLVQYTLAADRANETVARLYQPTHPAVLKLVRMTIAAAKRRGIPVEVCGESAADPVTGVLWAAFGADALSMSPSYIPAMSKVLAALSREDLAGYASFAEALPDSSAAAETLEALKKRLAALVGVS